MEWEPDWELMRRSLKPAPVDEFIACMAAVRPVVKPVTVEDIMEGMRVIRGAHLLDHPDLAALDAECDRFYLH